MIEKVIVDKIVSELPRGFYDTEEVAVEGVTGVNIYSNGMEYMLSLREGKLCIFACEPRTKRNIEKINMSVKNDCVLLSFDME